MAKKYIDEVLSEVFDSANNTATRQLSEAGNTHHAIITTQYFENAYAIGLDDAGIPYTAEDLQEMSDLYFDAIMIAAPKKGLTMSPAPGFSHTRSIKLSVSPRDTKSKAKSSQSLEDIKKVVERAKGGKVRAKLNEIVKAGGGTTQGYTYETVTVGGKKKKKRRLNTSGQIQGGVQYAHGEGGGPKSSLATEQGLDVIGKLNSQKAEKKFSSMVTNGNIFYQTFNTHMADYYKKTLNWDVIKVNPNNKKAEISDTYEITGAFKYQDPDFAAKYDRPKGHKKAKDYEERYKATLRQELYKALQKSVNNGGMMANKLEGSPTPVKRAQIISAREFVEELEKALKAGDMRGVVTVKKALEKIKNSKAREKNKKNIKSKPKGPTNVKRGKTRAPMRSRGAARAAIQSNPLALKSLLQKALPAEIAKKMTGPPTLQYQTGRFAKSAEITDIVPMQKQIEIRYDYMQDPYRVFEPGSGSPLATTRRDPRDLIGGTIRELAQQLMGDKFLIRTKRV